MKGEIKMEKNTHSTFLVLRISEDKDNGRTDIELLRVSQIWLTLKDTKKAKDSIERLSPRFTWMITQYKIQQIFYKSFVQDEDDRKIV